MFKNISIIGPGLIGASVAMAISKSSLADQVKVWARSEAGREKCKGQAWADSVHTTIKEAVQDCDLVIICTPVDTIIPLFTDMLPHLSPGTLVTDVGSVKSTICQEALAVSKGSKCHFIGAHPMAGSEKAGMEHASAVLLKDATCLLTPSEDSPSELLQMLHQFWEALGMRPFSIDAQAHDALVAQISHLPHIVAASLSASLKGLDPDLFKFSGQGLKDTTRIAGGNPQLWESILSQNSPAILNSIEQFESALSAIKTSLKNKDVAAIHKALEEGQSVRGKIEHSK